MKKPIGRATGNRELTDEESDEILRMDYSKRILVKPFLPTPTEIQLECDLIRRSWPEYRFQSYAPDIVEIKMTKVIWGHDHRS